LSRKKRLRTPEEKMALAEHFRELRKRVVIIAVVVFVSMIFGFIWYNTRLFGIIPSLGDILRKPYCSIPPEARLQLGPEGSECRLLATGPFEQFMLRLKVGAVAGIVVTSPIWVYQVWAFIAPGLYKKEKKVTLIYVAAASILFMIGAVLAYYVVSKALDFLLQMGNNVQITALSGSQYFNFVLALIVIFGLSFELPLLLVTLNILGLLRYEQLKKWRRFMIFGLFCFAAFVTPGGDPLSMSALALTLTILQEIAIQICRINDKRRAKKQAKLMDVDDDSASELDPVSPLDDPEDDIAASEIPAPAPLAEENKASSYEEVSEKWGWVDDDIEVIDTPPEQAALTAGDEKEKDPSSQ